MGWDIFPKRTSSGVSQGAQAANQAQTTLYQGQTGAANPAAQQGIQSGAALQHNTFAGGLNVTYTNQTQLSQQLNQNVYTIPSGYYTYGTLINWEFVELSLWRAYPKINLNEVPDWKDGYDATKADPRKEWMVWYTSRYSKLGRALL